MSEVKYDYRDLDLSYELTSDGRLFVVNNQTNVRTERPWYKSGNESWVPGKRKSFVSALKMSIRDGEFDDLK